MIPRPSGKASVARNYQRALGSVRARSIFERYRPIPTYAIDYAVASQEDGFRALRELLDDSCCAIGAHLQPWGKPPFDEDISDSRNSYAGNPPPALEREKLLRLTEPIDASFQVRRLVLNPGECLSL